MVHLRKMRFTCITNSKNGQRVGILSEFTRLPHAVIETPTTAIFTKSGSVVHLTADVLSKVFKETKLLWVPLSNCFHLQNGIQAQGQGISKFTCLPEHLTSMTLNDILEVTPTGHFEGETVPMWTRHGKMKMTTKLYMDIVETFKPDMVLALADSRIALDSGSKRRSMSVLRTTRMFQECVKQYKNSCELQNSAFIGVIIGASGSKKCEESIEQMVAHKDLLSGIALSGLSFGGEDGINITADQLEPVLKKIDEVLPKNLLRIIEGCWNPAVVVAAVELGWDVFDGSYPVKLTNSGLALNLCFDGETNEDLCILDLKDERYKADFTPIQTKCECLACKKHTRAYINHLLNTREMLAQVLLNIHNLHHFDQMFRLARHHIKSNTFQTFKTDITNQYEKYRESQAILNNGDKNDETVSESQATKKKRLVNE